MIQFLIKLCSLALKEGTVRSDITQLSYSEWNLNSFSRVQRNYERQCYSLLNKLITKSKTKLCQWYAINIQYFLCTCPPLRLNLFTTYYTTTQLSRFYWKLSIQHQREYLSYWMVWCVVGYFSNHTVFWWAHIRKMHDRLTWLLCSFHAWGATSLLIGQKGKLVKLVYWVNNFFWLSSALWGSTFQPCLASKTETDWQINCEAYHGLH